MAVQAQYPSHVFFLNRNEQERKNTEYPLQPQAAGFLEQSALLFPTQPSNGGSPNTNRKRGREEAAPTGAAALRNYPINLLSLQQQQSLPATAALNTNTSATLPTTLIDLSLLHNQQPPPVTIVSTGLRLSFEDNHRPQQPSQQQQQQQVAQGGSFLSSLITEELTAQVKQQKDEMNSFLQSQAEQLRRTVGETRRRHYRTLLGLAEQSAARRLREKDAEVERAARRNAELEKRVAQLRAESMAWQAKARAEESAAAVLQAQLQQVAQERQGRAGDHPGCSAGADQAAAVEDAESAYVDPERREEASLGGAMVCRACRRRVVGLLLLPCRHLCVCRECGAGVETCPVCLCVRTACLEVFLS
uniref:Baculoviral IAP repeat-containing protein 4 n=1 Tax=Anthurium amnicola TaxID=1678845 RepID=A0A1D1YMD1_9ARAE